ncbi:MAG: epoxyqueuosine reductase QueH, partial [Campylobacteraceae bacterium]
TTLYMSPKKSYEQLNIAAKKIEKEFDLKVLMPDFRSGGGTQEQFSLAKKDRLYHQNYCGCLFALKNQRESQKRLLDELMSPVGREILPGSVEERIELYKSVIECEDKNQTFEINRKRFLNYRLLNGLLRFEKETIASYILFYSSPKKEFTKLTIDEEKQEFICKDEVTLLTLKMFNSLANTNYKNTKELIFKAIDIKTSLHVREKLDGELFSLSPIIVLDEIKKGKYEIVINSSTYQDVREVLVTF